MSLMPSCRVRWLRYAALAWALVLGTAGGARAGDAAPMPAMTVALVGDSTVTDNAGWGVGFVHCVRPELHVTNLSLGGRSSMSFIKQGHWKEALALKPDYVLLQFGHNDEKLDDPERGTKPDEGYRRYMNQYVDEARAAGIKPVLVTSLGRRQWSKAGDGHIVSSLVPYVNVVEQIAREKNVPLLDLHADSIALYEKIGKPGTDAMSPLKPATPTPAATRPAQAGAARPATGPATGPAMVLDNTHLNEKGSAAIGRLVADELARAVPELAAYVRHE